MFFKKKELENKKLRYPHLPWHHIANCEVGDEIQTCIGVKIITECDNYKFTAPGKKNGANFYEKSGFGNVGYFEGGNANNFKIIKKA